MAILAPRFSIIVVHYDGCVSHQDYRRGLNSLFAQTFQDFEIIALHDGPFTQENDWTHTVRPKCTRKRFNDWGHSLRDKGIRKARGEYILFLNADNTLDPMALAEIDHQISRPKYFEGDAENRIVIFPIRMMGCRGEWTNGTHIMSRYSGAPFFHILVGVPPVPNMIDAMQFCMKRELWLEYGGWKDKSTNSDGVMFKELAEQHGYRTCSNVLGSHY